MGLVVIVAFILLSGCKSVDRPEAREFARADPAPVIASQGEREVRVLASADRIDAVAKSAPEVQPALESETSEIRAAVASAPAEDVTLLIATFEGQLDDREREIERLSAQVKQLINQELRWQARGLTGLGIALVLAFGVSVAFGGGLVAAAKTWPIALMGVGCLGLAQIVAHPWFMPSIAGLLALGAGYAIYYVFDRHREGRLKSSLEKKASLLRKIVPVLDEARESASDTVRSVLENGVFARLSQRMNREDKVTVHEVRREIKEVEA